MQNNESHLIPKDILGSKQPQTALTVTQLNRAAKDLLEGQFFSVLVEGEISNFSRPSSGHWYFTLKDANAQIRCAMFRNRNLLCRTQVANGTQVAVRGKISLFEARGDYQLIIDNLENAGIGALQAKFEALKQRLQQEGLFDLSRKQSLPKNPHRVALVTSKSGAAVRDLLSVFQRRFANIEIDIIPVLVQGNEAAGQIADALNWLSQLGQHDAIIVGRGGGSIEDLWAFNEEIVARAIYHCPIPIVSAVGHETDVTIADFVADVRAPTPSAAAELLSPDSSEQLQKLKQLRSRLLHASQRHLKEQTLRLSVLSQGIKNPSTKLQQLMQRLDVLEQRSQRNLKQRFGELKSKLKLNENALKQLSPQRRLSDTKQRLNNLLERQIKQQQLILKNKRLYLEPQQQKLAPLISNTIKSKQQQLAHQAALLNSVNPLEILQRGFAVVKNAEEKLVKDVDQVNKNDQIKVQLRSGHLHATVNTIEPK